MDLILFCFSISRSNREFVLLYQKQWYPKCSSFISWFKSLLTLLSTSIYFYNCENDYCNGLLDSVKNVFLLGEPVVSGNNESLHESYLPNISPIKDSKCKCSIYTSSEVKKTNIFYVTRWINGVVSWGRV